MRTFKIASRQFLWGWGEELHGASAEIYQNRHRTANALDALTRSEKLFQAAIAVKEASYRAPREVRDAAVSIRLIRRFKLGWDYKPLSPNKPLRKTIRGYNPHPSDCRGCDICCSSMKMGPRY